LAAKKHQKMGSHYDSKRFGEPGQKRLDQIIETFAGFGVVASVGG